MLFMHKGAEKWIEHAVYTGERPKGKEDDYVQVTETDVIKAKFHVSKLVPMLGIPLQYTSDLMRFLDEWIRSTPYDQEQKNIYKMMSEEGMNIRAAHKIPANWRYYNNYIDLVLALYGEYCSQKKLEVESRVAEKILRSQKVSILLRSVAMKISVYAEKTFKENERDLLIQGKYKTLHPNMTWVEWKNSCKTMSAMILVPVLYDITMSFKKPLKWVEKPMDGGKITKQNMRMNVSTPNEDFDWTARARWAEVPIWAAPSFTAQLMLLVAKNALATPDEIRAFAYGIFAYWNQLYPQTATPIHRMYGVMTAAREFGVQDKAKACDPEKMYLEADRWLKS
jgi:hypothetical protein